MIITVTTHLINTGILREELFEEKFKIIAPFQSYKKGRATAKCQLLRILCKKKRKNWSKINETNLFKITKMFTNYDSSYYITFPLSSYAANHWRQPLSPTTSSYPMQIEL